MAIKRHLGRIEFQGKDMPGQAAKYDRIAIDHKKRIMLVSVVAESQFVKAIRAILNGGAKAEINASEGQVSNPDLSWSYASNPGRCAVTTESYECHTQKLKFGLVHAMFVTRMPGFMPVMSEPAIWRELTDIRYTTPVIREWLPYITEKLRSMELLRTCESFNFPHQIGTNEAGEPIHEVMRCGVLEATTADLDLIVSDGLRSGAITITRPESIMDPTKTEGAA